MSAPLTRNGGSAYESSQELFDNSTYTELTLDGEEIIANLTQSVTEALDAPIKHVLEMRKIIERSAANYGPAKFETIGCDTRFSFLHDAPK